MNKPPPDSKSRFCKERPRWRSVKRVSKSAYGTRNATEGIRYECRRGTWRAGDLSPLFGAISKSRSTCRRGYLLTEMLVVISVSSALAVVAVGMLGTLMRIERSGRRHFEETNGLARLSKQFRRDVAAAEEASVPAENTGRPSEIHLRLATDHTVRYRAEPGVLLRLDEWGQTEAARERFRLPATSEARFGIDDGRSGRMVALTLDAPRPANESPKTSYAVDADKKRRRIVARDGVSRRGWTIEALVARDLRHAPSSSNVKPTAQEPAP